VVRLEFSGRMAAVEEPRGRCSSAPLEHFTVHGTGRSHVRLMDDLLASAVGIASTASEASSTSTASAWPDRRARRAQNGGATFGKRTGGHGADPRAPRAALSHLL